MDSAYSPPRHGRLLHLLCLLICILSLFSASHAAEFEGVDPRHPVRNISLSPLVIKPSVRGSRDVISCGRVQVSGYSRMRLNSYANSLRVTLTAPATIPERFHSKIQVCFHRNASLGSCQCEQGEWRPIHKGLWFSVMSPYDKRYIDVKFNGDFHGSISISVEEDFQRWRFFCLVLGFALLLLAPIVSGWVPFYYSSSMAIGVFLVILIILFQGMKLLPTGRKNLLYLTIYGSVLGAGSFVLHQFSVIVNMILDNFGLSEEMHIPVSVLLLVAIIILGAALGSWIVRKFVISEDGSVDAGIAQFVKWAMRVIGATFVLQSSPDPLLAMGVLVSFSTISFLITKGRQNRSNYKGRNLWQIQAKQPVKKHGRAEFLSRSPNMASGRNLWNNPKGSPNMTSGRNLWNNPKGSPSISDSPVKGFVSPSVVKHASTNRKETEYYSTFHTTPNRKRFNKEEWEEFTRESTNEALAGMIASPEFTDWVVENTHRIQRVRSDSSDDDAMESESESIDDNTVQSWKLFGL